MRTLYFECNMGAAGDMLMAALLELHPDPQGFLHRLNALGIPDVKVTAISSMKCGITGTHIEVKIGGIEEESLDVSNTEPIIEKEHHHDHHEHHEHEGHHHHDHHDHEEHPHGHQEHDHHEHEDHYHSGMSEIEHLIHHLPVSEKVRDHALQVYQLIAKAESHAHNAPIEQIHFHEVGTMDAVMDIVGVCMLMEELAPEKILASPIHVGSGQVRCAHGILPVPTPATAYILQGIPMYGGAIRGELCTPTGAALLKHFVQEFGSMPVIEVAKIGYGMGKKDFEAANCVRAFLGKVETSTSDIIELSCNLDDMTGEAIGFAMETLFENGALDVYTTSIGMKKSRPGIMLTCMCKVNRKEDMIKLMFQHTSTLGIRVNTYQRYTLQRTEMNLDTEFGTVRVKQSSGYGVEKVKVEYEDLAKIARENNLSLDKLTKLIK